jgi:hypothetical protein
MGMFILTTTTTTTTTIPSHHFTEQNLEIAGAKMAPTSSRQTKPVQSPEPHLDSSQASSGGMADSQGTEAINTMIEQKLKHVSIPSTRSLSLHLYFVIPIIFGC